MTDINVSCTIEMLTRLADHILDHDLSKICVTEMDLNSRLSAKSSVEYIIHHMSCGRKVAWYAVAPWKAKHKNSHGSSIDIMVMLSAESELNSGFTLKELISYIPKDEYLLSLYNTVHTEKTIGHIHS